MGTGRPGRRYPPTPYPPRTDDTARYRDGWDRGWELAISRRRAIDHDADLEPGAYQHGFRDGATARWAREERLRASDLAARRREQEEARRQIPDEDPW